MSEKRSKQPLEQLGDDEVRIVIDPSEFDATAGNDIPDMPVIPRSHDTAKFLAIPQEMPTEKITRGTAPGIPAVIMRETASKADSRAEESTPEPTPSTLHTAQQKIERIEKGAEDTFIMHWLHPDEIHEYIDTYGKSPNNMQHRMMKLAQEKASWYIGSDTVLPKDPFMYLYDQFSESIGSGETAKHPIVAHLVEKWNNHEIDGTISPTDFKTLYEKERDIGVDITESILDDIDEKVDTPPYNENVFTVIDNLPKEADYTTTLAPENEDSENIFTPALQANGYTTITPNFPNIPPRQQIPQKTTPEKPPSRFWKKLTTRVGALAATLAVAFGIYKANDTHENTPVQTTEASPDTHPTIEELSPTQVRTAVASTQQVLEEVIDEGSSRQSSDEVVHRIVERIAQNDAPEGRIPEAQIEPVIASTQPSIKELIHALQPERLTVVAQQLESIVTHVRETLIPQITPTQAKPETLPQAAQTPITLRIGNAAGERNSVWGTIDRLEDMDIRRPDGTSPWSNHSEFHTWRMNELRRLGYEQRGDQWGHPFTVHDGAQVQLSFDTSGTPHVELLDPTKNQNPAVVPHSELHFPTTVATTENPDTTEKDTNPTEKQVESQKSKSTEYTDVDVNGTKIHTGDTIQIVSKSGRPIQYTITKITSANGPKRLILRSLDGKINTFKDIKNLVDPLSFSLITRKKR